MSEDLTDLEQLVEARLVRVSAMMVGLATGVVSGAGLFVATLWLVVKGGPNPGPHLALLSQYFFGYRVTFLGCFIGFFYAFLCGFVLGYAGALIYDRVALARSRPRT
jgi:hypothetical protein